jgi:heptosyltransferase-2
LWIWNKKNGKYKNLFRLLKTIRAQRYDVVINTQRFASTGIISALSTAKTVIGFAKNPLSCFFTCRVQHSIDKGTHEVARNLKLIEGLTDASFEMPKLYPSAADFDFVKPYQTVPYITISPASVWFTKQLPMHKWQELIATMDKKYTIYLLGAASDNALCAGLADGKRAVSLAGKLTLLQSAALMQSAAMNYMNDSAPLHLASAMNAPTTCIFCSTVPDFGFGPLADNARIVETKEVLPCRPCG